MHGVVPLSYRHNSKQIKTFLFFGNQQKKELIITAGLWSDINEEIEVFNEEGGADSKVDALPVSTLFPEKTELVICPGISLDFITSYQNNIDKRRAGFKHVVRMAIKRYAEVITKNPSKWSYDHNVCGGFMKNNVDMWLCQRIPVENADVLDEFTFWRVSCSREMKCDEYLCDNCDQQKYRLYRKLDKAADIRSGNLKSKTNNRF
uniref:Uncharacterized protein n=1 Tax=Corethron hystrix TaxID=216773 RepID=A0A7S1BZA8_9STRA|mmetsp:Transcript_5550/g.11569  ORF Transcript_5550/g.11569 Transcript_5550/m.11569 type:complete len:205 (+) Transcript_5550:575-1189(+)